MTSFLKFIGFLILAIIISSFAYTSTLSFDLKKTLQNTVVQDSVLPDSIITVDTTLIFSPYKEFVHASYYHDKFNGRKTSNGEIFDNNLYTAAHKTLKFGTKVRVTNTVNGKSVIVTVNDRGPFVKGREIDLAKTPFMEIAKYKQRGYLIVHLEVLEEQ